MQTSPYYLSSKSSPVMQTAYVFIAISKKYTKTGQCTIEVEIHQTFDY